MTNEQAKKRWAKPELERLGKLKDVAGPNPVGSQGATTKT